MHRRFPQRYHLDTMTKLAISLSALLLFAACGGSHPAEEGARLEPGTEKFLNTLTLFVEAVQSDRFDKAMGYLTPEEKAKFTEGAGVVQPPMQKRLKALRLSTLASKPGVRLDGDKLEGIFPWLPNLELAPPEPAAGHMPPPLP